MPCSLSVDFAGTIVRFDLSCPSLQPLLRDRYHRFITQKEPAHFSVRWEAEEGRQYRYSEPENGGFGVVSSGPDTRNLDLALRSLLPRIVSGPVFHCAFLRGDDERGFLCCGQPGAGKSTIARLLGQRALCDEMAAVDEELTAHSLPYWSSQPGSAALSGVYILSHGPEHRRTRLSQVAAFRELTRHVYWPTGDDHPMRHAMHVVGLVAEKIPVWHLEFLPQADVWDLIIRPELSDSGG